MATIKSYTDLEQSKKLAEILPLESADMCYIQDLLAGCKYGEYKPYIGNLIPAYGQDKIRCWSLAALLGIIREIIGYTLQTTYDKDPKVFIVCELGDKPYSIASLEYDNEVDACYEMIIRLNEIKML